MDEKLSSEEGIEELFETYLIKSIEHLSPKGNIRINQTKT